MTSVLEPVRAVGPVELRHPVTLLHGAVEDALALIPDRSVSAVLTDPPYNLAMGGGTEGWDAIKDFSGWCALWGRELLRITKPGGWLVAFGSSRTWHDLATGMDRAGWDIMDSIIWHYPSGFVRTVPISDRLLTAGFVDRAAQVAGRGTMVHSRHEPAILARAPLAKGGLLPTVAEYGTATMDLEGCALPNGSAPPNVLVQHSSLCGGEDDDLPCVPGCPVPAFGGDISYFPTFRFEGKPSRDERPFVRVEAGAGTANLSTLGSIRAWSCAVCGAVTQSYMKSGSRYSNRPHPVCDHDSYVLIKDNFSSVIKHNTVKPLGLMRWLVRLLTLPGDRIIEPFAGSGSTVEAAVLEGREVVAVERDLSSIELCRVRLRRQGCFVPEST